MKGFFVTGIGTDIGKTVVSAILVEAMNADYWKPIQCGNLDFTDSNFIRDYTNKHQTIHPESYLFPEPVSPHLAAKLNSKNIDLEIINSVKSNNYLIVEGAGGLDVPLSDKYLIKDLIKIMQLPVIVVSMNYLGSINHSLLTIDALKQENIPIAGIIFNGPPNSETENYILEFTGIPLLGKVPKTDIMTKGFIIQEAEKIRKTILSILPVLPEKDNLPGITIDYESF